MRQQRSPDIRRRKGGSRRPRWTVNLATLSILAATLIGGAVLLLRRAARSGFDAGAVDRALSGFGGAGGTRNMAALPEGWREIWPLPNKWEDYSFYRIRKHFKCKQYAQNITKPMPTDEDWAMFKKTYQEAVDPDATFDDPVPGSLGYTFGEGGPPPYHARHGERGRGLFASRNITKGEVVDDVTHSQLKFPSGHSWRKYIFALPRSKACDMIDWTWTQEYESDGKIHLVSAMNIQVLMNGGNRETINVSPESDHSMKEYALRNITEGEEILTNYAAVVTDSGIFRPRWDVWTAVGGLNPNNEQDEDEPMSWWRVHLQKFLFGLAAVLVVIAIYI